LGQSCGDVVEQGVQVGEDFHGRDAACCQRVRSSPIAIEGRLRVALRARWPEPLRDPFVSRRVGTLSNSTTVETCAGPPAIRGAIRGAKWGHLGWLESSYPCRLRAKADCLPPTLIRFVRS
jgi:hypothetical protein